LHRHFIVTLSSLSHHLLFALCCLLLQTSFVMSSQDKGNKRARTEQQDGAGALDDLPGREQLLLASPEMQTRLGRRFCAEAELLPLLLAQGLIRRVRTIEIQVRPLGGDSFKVTLEAAKPTVGETKAAIARVQGTAEACQELHKVAERADGLAVREDDAEPELLEDESIVLEEGDMVAMAVKESPLLWHTFPADAVTLSDGGAVATHTLEDYGFSLTTTGIELAEGKHYWEVELMSKAVSMTFVGIIRPNLNPTGDYYESDDGWLMYAYNGALKEEDDGPGPCKQGDRVGVLLDLDDGSLRFFKNGVQHGPGYPAGSVTGPVVHAVQMYGGGGAESESVRLLPNAEAPVGVAQDVAVGG
jgi:hypothetical protein